MRETFEKVSFKLLSKLFKKLHIYGFYKFNEIFGICLLKNFLRALILFMTLHGFYNSMITDLM